MNQIQENEISKYLKKKESNISKTNKKSKHKHQYEECLIQYKFDFAGKKCIDTSLKSYCTICGKIGDKFKDGKSIVEDYHRVIDGQIKNYKCYSIISGEELYEKYHDRLPIFFIEDIWKNGYVNLEQNEK